MEIFLIKINELLQFVDRWEKIASKKNAEGKLLLDWILSEISDNQDS